MHDDTIATYTDGGKTYEIDHLGISCPEQWGEFAVYCDDETVTGFCIPESSLAPQYRPAELPLTTDALIAHAKGAVAGEFASDDDVGQYLEVQGMIGRHLSSSN